MLTSCHCLATGPSNSAMSMGIRSLFPAMNACMISSDPKYGFSSIVAMGTFLYCLDLLEFNDGRSRSAVSFENAARSQILTYLPYYFCFCQRIDFNHIEFGLRIIEERFDFVAEGADMVLVKRHGRCGGSVDGGGEGSRHFSFTMESSLSLKR